MLDSAFQSLDKCLFVKVFNFANALSFLENKRC